MTPEEYYHDHPVIDEQDDGICLYWHELPPFLLKNPPRIRYPTADDDEKKK